MSGIHRRLLAWVLSAAAGITGAAYGADGRVDALMRQTATKLFHQGAPGVAIAVIFHGETYFWTGGSSGRPGLAVTPRTLFETASISKVFTTALLGVDVASGRLSLDEPIRKDLRGCPLRGHMRQATFEMLATFTAGLPLDPPALANTPIEEQGIDNFSTDEFLRFVSEWRPPRPLPASCRYSNVSVGLLGLCLGRQRLGIFEGRLLRLVFRPLGMHDTMLFLDAPHAARLAIGETPGGTQAAAWPVDADAAADGIKSTVSDLAQFLRGMMGLSTDISPALAAGLVLSANHGFSTDGEFQALGWRWKQISLSGLNEWAVTKNGDIPGFSTDLAFNKDLGIGVAILTNRGNLPAEQDGLELMQALWQLE
jgi:beta-lactamase class C